MQPHFHLSIADADADAAKSVRMDATTNDRIIFDSFWWRWTIYGHF